MTKAETEILEFLHKNPGASGSAIRHKDWPTIKNIVAIQPRNQDLDQQMREKIIKNVTEAGLQ